MSTDAKQSFNLGKDVSTKCFGVVTIHEFTIDDIFAISDVLVELAQVLQKNIAIDPGLQVAALISDPTTHKALKKLISRAIGKDINEVQDAKIPISDLLNIVKAVFEMNDFEEWKKNFMPVLTSLGVSFSTTS